MFNRQIEITRENESLLFINAVIENLRYGIIHYFCYIIICHVIH